MNFSPIKKGTVNENETRRALYDPETRSEPTEIFYRFVTLLEEPRRWRRGSRDLYGGAICRPVATHTGIFRYSNASPAIAEDTGGGGSILPALELETVAQARANFRELGEGEPRSQKTRSG